MSGPRIFEGAVATGYNAKRENAPKWHAEQALLKELLSQYDRDTTVLDVPVGTGRLIPIFEENRFVWTGMDISQDMLAEARKTVTDKTRCRLLEGSVLDLGNREVDVSCMIRLTRWLSPEERTRAASELMRVTKKAIYLTARIYSSPYPYTLEQIVSDYDGWGIQAYTIGDDGSYNLLEVTQK